MDAACYRCGAELRFEGVVGRRAECPACGVELHACLTCRHRHHPRQALEALFRRK